MTKRSAGRGKRAGLSEAQPPASGRAAQAAQRLAKVAAALFDCRTALVVLDLGDRTRIVCGYGLPHNYRTVEGPFQFAPTDSAGRYIVPDVEAAGVDPWRGHARDGRTGFFLGAPVPNAAGAALALIVADARPRPAPSPDDLHVLDEIVALIGEELTEVLPLLTDPQAHVTVPLTYDQLLRSIDDSDRMAALLDANLKILAISQPAARLFGKSRSEMIGHLHSEYPLAAGQTLELFFRRALEAGISSPDLEVVGAAELGSPVYALIASPLSPIGDDSYFLKVSAREITQRVARADLVDERVAREHREQPDALEPTAEFLFETLAERRAIRSRAGVSYVTLRAWRKPVRDYQLNALKALKRHRPRAFVDRIAAEIEASVQMLVGGAAFKCVVPTPCGHSRTDECLSVAIARALAARLNLPMAQAFAHQRLKGSSHPKANATRPPLVLRQPVTEPALLVDDVATSGSHLAEAATLLKPHCGAVLPIAWIGGDASAD